MRVQVIKLSDAVQQLPREQTLFVHGVPPCFLSAGDRMAASAQQVMTSLYADADQKPICLQVCASMSSPALTPAPHSSGSSIDGPKVDLCNADCKIKHGCGI